jgi:SAM-dependent methyltransferase
MNKTFSKARRVITALFAGSPKTQDPSLGLEETRRAIFGKYISANQSGIEIGSLTRPVFPANTGFRVGTVDHASTRELRKKYADDPNVDVDEIVEVNWVWPPGLPLSKIPGIPQTYDFIIACHVIEHSPDLITFLVDCESVLRSGGKLLLAVPSRDLMFDYYRPLSTMGDVISGHLFPHAHDVKAEMEEIQLRSTLDGKICWSHDDAKSANAAGRQPERISSREMVVPAIKNLSEFREKKGYRDGHRWVFTEESLFEIVELLHDAELIKLYPSASHEGIGCEFLLILEKN